MTATKTGQKKPRRSSVSSGVLFCDNVSPVEDHAATLPQLSEQSQRHAKWRRELKAMKLYGAKAARADAVIAALAKLWPRCFSTHPPMRKPLMIGIDAVLIKAMQPAILAGRISEEDLRLALRRYTSSKGYFRHCAVIGSARINLSGEKAGTVDPAHVKYARALLMAGRAS
jgi:hypothetical protein